ncbi:MAG: flippase-like domain-containing protein [Bacteroidota bacterium]|nr:flippase-like domain-containing protein [Bacteroidota bacterium]
MTNEEQALPNEFDEQLRPKTLKQKIWNITKVVLKVGVTSALLIWVFSKVDINSVKYRLLHPKYWWMYGAAIVCFFFSMIVSAWRLLSFFRSIGLNLNPRYNLRLYFLGLFYNFLLPGGIGGDGYKMYLINKTYKVPVKKLFWAVMFDRLSGLWAIGLITVVLIFLIPQINIHIGIPLGIFAAGSAIYYFIAYRFFRDYTRNFFEAHAKALLLQSLQLLAIICIILSQPDFYEPGFHGKFSPYLLSFLISGFAIIIPITAGGAGAREAIFMNMSKVFPMKPDLAILLATSFYLVSLIVAFLGIYYVIRPSRLHDGLPEEKLD